MQKGDLARGWDGWLCRLLAKTKHGWRVRWETGALKGRDANVCDPELRKVG